MRSFVSKAFVFTLIAVFAFPYSVFADTLSLSPSSGSYTVGQTFSVRVLVSSPNQAINAISGVLSFPREQLQVTSISKVGSIVSLWVQEPTFSNSAGTVSFEGVVPNPGFSRSNGTAVTVNFRVVAPGTANIRFNSGSLLANDGLGTNILRNLGSASFTFSPRSSEPVQQTVPPEPQTQEVPVEVSDVINAPEPQKEITVPVPSMTLVLDWFVRIMSLLIPLIALIFFLVYLTMHGLHRAKTTKASLRRELHEIDRLVGKSFDLLKEDIEDSIKMLERAKSRRQLTKEEDAIVERLRQNLSDAERVIHKEVMKAEKHL